MYLKSLLLILFWLFNPGKGVFSPDIRVYESGYMFGDGKNSLHNGLLGEVSIMCFSSTNSGPNHSSWFMIAR